MTIRFIGLPFRRYASKFQTFRKESHKPGDNSSQIPALAWVGELGNVGAPAQVLNAARETFFSVLRNSGLSGDTFLISP